MLDMGCSCAILTESTERYRKERPMSLSSRLQNPAVSLSADGGHGAHCYDADGILTCGWPNEHTLASDIDFSNNSDLDDERELIDQRNDYMDKLRTMREEGDTE